MKPIPFGILTDSPECGSGLARIGRDIASRLYRAGLPIRLATFGFNGQGSKEFPWQQYSLGNFGNASHIPRIIPSWLDWVDGEKGILFTIYDIQRLEAFRFPQIYGRPWCEFLASEKFTLCGYFPIDSHTPDGTMTSQSREILRAFDHILAYGPYGQTILRNSLDKLDPPHSTLSRDKVEWIPHGLDLATFHRVEGGREILSRKVPTELKDPEEKPILRTLSVGPEDKLLGVVATNNPRKDWPLFFQVLSNLEDWKGWANIDDPYKYWNIEDLAEQYGVKDRVFLTTSLPEGELVKLYSACNATLGIGSEGYGYPLVESMACDVPVVAPAVAGGGDLLPTPSRVATLYNRIEGAYCLGRPVMDPKEVADRIRYVSSDEVRTDWRKHASTYDWNRVWPEFKNWFRAIITEVRTKEVHLVSAETK